MPRSVPCCVLVLLLAASPARAEEVTPAPPVPVSPLLDASQLAVLSTLVKADAGQLQLRLSTSPQLMPLAVEAAVERRARRRAGVGMLAGGISCIGIAVIGAPLFFALGFMASAPALVVVAAVAAVAILPGVALTIVGIVKLARVSEAERRFEDAWARLPPPSLRAPPARDFAAAPALVYRF